jgi:uncharacterized protein (DUF2062 family)
MWGKRLDWNCSQPEFGEEKQNLEILMCTSPIIQPLVCTSMIDSICCDLVMTVTVLWILKIYERCVYPTSLCMALMCLCFCKYYHT